MSRVKHLLKSFFAYDARTVIKHVIEENYKDTIKEFLKKEKELKKLQEDIKHQELCYSHILFNKTTTNYTPHYSNDVIPHAG